MHDLHPGHPSTRLAQQNQWDQTDPTRRITMRVEQNVCIDKAFIFHVVRRESVAASSPCQGRFLGAHGHADEHVRKPCPLALSAPAA